MNFAQKPSLEKVEYQFVNFVRLYMIKPKNMINILSVFQCHLINANKIVQSLDFFSVLPDHCEPFYDS